MCIYIYIYIYIYISAASARTLILKVLAHAQHLNQAWLKKLKAQEQSWMVTEWLKNNDGSRTRMVQEQSWLKNNDGSRTIYGGSTQWWFHFQQTAGDLETQCTHAQAKCKLKVNGFAQLDTSDGKPHLIQSMDLAGGTKKQPFWQHGGTILVDSQAATIKGPYDMWLNWLPTLHRHTSCGSPEMHGCTKSRLHLFEGIAEPYQIRATLKDPVLNPKVYTQQAMLAHCCPTRLQQHLAPPRCKPTH